MLFFLQSYVLLALQGRREMVCISNKQKNLPEIPLAAWRASRNVHPSITKICWDSYNNRILLYAYLLELILNGCGSQQEQILLRKFENRENWWEQLTAYNLSPEKKQTGSIDTLLKWRSPSSKGCIWISKKGVLQCKLFLKFTILSNMAFSSEQPSYIKAPWKIP